MDIISDFQYVRDIPYRLPLGLSEEDFSCSAKHKILKERLAKKGHEARYRVCSFLWSSLGLPKEISSIPHDDYSTHLFLEVLIDEKWLTVDATWDIGLRNIFHINEWDGKSNTEIAVIAIKIFTPQESAEIMDGADEAEEIKELEANGEFYRAFNGWLEGNRGVSAPIG